MSSSESPKTSAQLLLNHPNHAHPVAYRQSNTITAAFFLLGLGILLPWSAILSALDFYALAHPHIPAAQYLTNAYTFSFMLCGVFPVFTPTAHREPLILFSFIAMLTISAVIPYLPHLHIWPHVVATALLGCVNGLAQCCLYGIVNRFPNAVVTTAFNSGGALASLLIVALRILTRLILDDHSATVQALRPGFRLFFLVCAGLCLLCVLVFYWLYRYCHQYAQRMASDNDIRIDLNIARDTLSDIKQPAFCLFACFTITMILFPGILARIPLSHRHVSATYASWYPLFVVALFAVGDIVGRSCWSETISALFFGSLFKLTILRFITIPLYVFIWIAVLPSFRALSFLLVLAHGLTNGFLMNFAFLTAPQCTSQEKGEVAGRLMFVMLILGLFCGSSSGWILDYVLTRFFGF